MTPVGVGPSVIINATCYYTRGIIRMRVQTAWMLGDAAL